MTVRGGDPPVHPIDPVAQTAGEPLDDGPLADRDGAGRDHVALGPGDPDLGAHGQDRRAEDQLDLGRRRGQDDLVARLQVEQLIVRRRGRSPDQRPEGHQQDDEQAGREGTAVADGATGADGDRRPGRVSPGSGTQACVDSSLR